MQLTLEEKKIVFVLFFAFNFCLARGAPCRRVWRAAPGRQWNPTRWIHLSGLPPGLLFPLAPVNTGKPNMYSAGSWDNLHGLICTYLRTRGKPAGLRWRHSAHSSKTLGCIQYDSENSTQVVVIFKEWIEHSPLLVQQLQIIWTTSNHCTRGGGYRGRGEGVVGLAPRFERLQLPGFPATRLKDSVRLSIGFCCRENFSCFPLPAI
jgi:hypothetical protein